MTKSTRSRPSISKTDKNWYSEQEISIMKKAAFDKGFEHGTAGKIKEYTDNLFWAQKKSTEFFQLCVSECEVDFKQIRLKATAINSFKLVFIMAENNFLSKDIYKKVYECGLDFLNKSSVENDEVCLTFMYMPDGDSLNDNEFILNGFSFTYDPNRKVKS